MVLEMGAFVVGGAFAGSWLDERLSTSPLMLLLLSTSMLVLGIYRIHKAISQEENSSGTNSNNS